MEGKKAEEGDDVCGALEGGNSSHGGDEDGSSGGSGESKHAKEPPTALEGLVVAT